MDFSDDESVGSPMSVLYVLSDDFLLFRRDSSFSSDADELMRSLEATRVDDPERHRAMWRWIGGSMSDTEATMESELGQSFDQVFPPGLSFEDLGEWVRVDPDDFAALGPVLVRSGED